MMKSASSLLSVLISSSFSIQALAYYHPDEGRWLSRDPIGEAGGFNLYVLTGNDGVNGLDYLGLLERDKNGDIVAKQQGKPIQATHPSGPSSQMQPVEIKANDGTPIQGLSNVGPDKRLDCDCHGVTFGDGEYWINNDQVDKILKGDGYAKTPKPQVGDAVIYRENGQVVHSATVKTVDPKTGAVTVEGKGGIEPKAHINSVTPGPGGAWLNPNAAVEYYKPPQPKPGAQNPACPAAARAQPSQPQPPNPAPNPAPPAPPNPKPPPAPPPKP